MNDIFQISFWKELEEVPPLLEVHWQTSIFIYSIYPQEKEKPKGAQEINKKSQLKEM